MNKQQIQALIDEKIRGQGNQVDSGGALATILGEILDMASAGANVQSDWDENDNTDPSFIKNKPTIPAAQVQSDWDEADNTNPAFIKNKPTIPSSQPTIITATRNVGTDAIEIADEEKIKLQPLIENGEWQKAIVRIEGAYDYAILATTHQPNLYSITIRAREQASIKDVTISWSEIQA